jgi:ubiquinone/menaquinone biosynthesis C-methylase UbiE
MKFGNMQEIVTAGYDKVADRYASWAAAIYSPERERVTELVLNRVEPDRRVLELGCGNGEPTARLLSQHFEYTGVDISTEQLRRAADVAPSASFVEADMASLAFPDAHFSAVIALFSIVHIPCEQHGALIQSVYRWLEPGGLFVFNSGANAAYRGYEEDWLGAPMFWSHYGPETTRQLVLDAGFEILSQRVETINEGHGAATFVWWTAVKPETGQTA